ncbi:MAG TPA: SAM-dependent methyltransferase [Ktedonobacteraceae bacterium]|nr:SAM-dependent methyltransferase [Ktedonobacteraceae bacterium]
MTKDFKRTITQMVQDENTFLKLTLKGQIREKVMPWRRVVVRPVLIKNVRHLQFSYFDAKQDITKNYRGTEAQEKLDALLTLPFNTLLAQSTTDDIHVRITKEGRALINQSKPTCGTEAPDLTHDAHKELPLPANKPDAFLQRLGIMDKQGKVFPSMQGKFSQINEFLKLLEHTGEIERLEQTPVQILDCGCGSAYLSFAVYHYLTHVRELPTRIVGIDTNEKLIAKGALQSKNLGFGQMCFQKSTIIDYAPEVPPDIILALHACDTATDEVLVQGILANARLILCVPCCHHELHQQLHALALFKPVLQDGILKKRLVDILTDTFRAHILRSMGYKTDVVEFISSEHTDRNLMIRAVKRSQAGDAKVMQEYEELKNFWGVTPYIEKLLREKGCWRV